MDYVFFIAGTLLMFYMGLRSTLFRLRLMRQGQRVEARVAGTVQSRQGTAYLLEFATAGGSHRLQYPAPRKGKGLPMGSQVVLYYDPDHPEKLYVQGDKAVLGAEVVYYVLTAALVVLSVLLAVQ
ncbi:MAG TPA: DUF3592 domain-containing protein [Candidatus Faecalibacterium intestinipullorum]|nr:DUF3592 domain-containing protein [Candidatus Faecalibacterium intestinipullorum]